MTMDIDQEQGPGLAVAQEYLSSRKEQIIAPLASFCGQNANDQNVLQKDIDELLQFFKYHGQFLGKHRPDLADEFIAQAQQLCKNKHELTQQQASVAQVEQQFVPSLYREQSLMDKIQQAHAQRLADTQYVAQQDAEFQDIHSKFVGDGDDVEIDNLDADRFGFVNQQCPITMSNVLELNDPVEDSQGFVYERAAIQQHIKNHIAHHPNQNCPCPVFGASHTITLAELTKSRRVQLALKRQQKGVGNQEQEQVDIVV